MIKKADILLGVFLILLCLASLFLLRPTGSAASGVTVTVDGKPYGIYDLDEDQVIDIDPKETSHHNQIKIADQTVLMTESNCANQVCVHQGRITHGNQTIVCLPNKVVVSISEEAAGMDAVSY